MFAKISYTWGLMRASWNVLKTDKTLLLFPLMSGLCCIVVLLSFALPIFLTGAWAPPARGSSQVSFVVYYGLLFLFYIVNYFVITFFNTAIVSCAMLRMAGHNATVGDGFREAASRIPQIAGWAVLSATVGLILRIIEDRSERLGRIVAGLLGIAWTLMSFLVVPVIVGERKGPFAALKESSAMLRRTWGEQLVSGFSFGLIFMLLGIPAMLLIFAGIALAAHLGSIWLMVLCVIAAVVYLIALSLLQSALQSIFQTALYLYAYNQMAPPGFAPELLANALRQK
ncbi:MAG TPA: DUF6159 family protein [Verrucomicrobiae bacterium]|nr:DUF6159 family protein [Verrucomicrobiae bacterium]